MKSYHQITSDIASHIKELKRDIPNVIHDTYTLINSATTDGVLDKKTKELIALALGVAQRCDGCIGFHAKALVKLGATQQEVSEALGVAIQMGGGPALMTAAEAIQAFLEFSNVKGE